MDLLHFIYLHGIFLNPIFLNKLSYTYPSPGAREEPPRIQGQGGGREEQRHVQGVVAVRAQEDLEESFHVESQEGRWEEIPLIQGKEQQLCFAGAVAVLCWSSCEEIPHAQGKRNSSKMVGVARGHQRAYTLKPY